MEPDVFTAPIPGESLTTEPGSRPWEQPPQFTTVEEATEHYIRAMSGDAFREQLMDVLEMNVPVTTLADTIQTSGVMKGLHTVDVGILIMPVIMEMIMYLGDEEGVKYVKGTDGNNRQLEKAREDMLVLKAKRELEKELEGDSQEEEMEPSLDEELPVEPKGLMAKRTK